ncbi:DnaJ-containing protein [Naegleria gruberi]|uniref:DnaJ-containing protein n=1 Tax=Naegleria gruberi TaxID=5762 RepID=D2VJW0_NAEGR|nr:DnaJ-containing protein [Naegleria gruberi]EFC42838.1 DnaJ-containing protein [Naegleria gruberi]|eukprot:XP_002675582.1 DnaJ-containing protein [Naegleria gruberi strain NEG-M]
MALILMVEARDPKGYYKTLGVSEKASQQEIKKAYRKLSMAYHPDKARNKPQTEQKTLQQQYMKILEAYETLSNEDKRRQYDRGGFDPFEHHQHHGHDQESGSFHFSFGGGGDDNDPFEDFPQFFKHHFRSQGQGHNPFFSFFGDDDEDDAPPFGFHFESNSRRKNQKRRASSRKTQEPAKQKDSEGGFFSNLFSTIGDFYNAITSNNEDDSEQQEYQTVKKIITQINPDGSRTTRVVYEKVPINNKRRTVFRF